MRNGLTILHHDRDFPALAAVSALKVEEALRS
jgi:hypothetical protein